MSPENHWELLEEKDGWREASARLDSALAETIRRMDAAIADGMPPRDAAYAAQHVMKQVLMLPENRRCGAGDSEPAMHLAEAITLHVQRSHPDVDFLSRFYNGPVATLPEADEAVGPSL